MGAHRAISTASLPKRRPQEVWQNGAPLSPAAASQGLLGACMGMSALFVLMQRLLAKGAHVSCVAIKKKKKKRLKKSRWIHEHSPDLEGGSERSAVPGLCTKIRAGLQHQTRQKGFAHPLSKPKLPTSSVPPTQSSSPSADPRPPLPAAEPHAPGVAEGTGQGFLSLPNVSWHGSLWRRSPRLPDCGVSLAACRRWLLAASLCSPTCPFWCWGEGGGCFPSPSCSRYLLTHSDPECLSIAFGLR